MGLGGQGGHLRTRHPLRICKRWWHACKLHCASERVQRRQKGGPMGRTWQASRTGKTERKTRRTMPLAVPGVTSKHNAGALETDAAAAWFPRETRDAQHRDTILSETAIFCSRDAPTKTSGTLSPPSAVIPRCSCYPSGLTTPSADRVLLRGSRGRSLGGDSCTTRVQLNTGQGYKSP